MKYILIVVFTVLTATSAISDEFIQWHDTSITGLYGTGFEVDPETQITLTAEHANGWKWGDFFMFVDWINYIDEPNDEGEDMSYYGEIAPRLSAGKIIGTDVSILFVRDWLVAACYEFGDSDVENYLVGPGIDLDVPGFDFFQLNLYRRFNSGASNVQSYQLTPVWKLTAPMGGSTFIFDGFIDWVFGDSTDSLHICPQFKVDIGVLFGVKPRSLLAGVEYDYWKNKYDIATAPEQHAVSAIVQYHF